MNTRWHLVIPAVSCLVAVQAHGGDDGESAQFVPEASGELSDTQVTMTWVSGGNRYAAINGDFYTVGDTMPDGSEVLAIESGIVRIRKNGAVSYVRMVEKPPSPNRPLSANDAPADDLPSYLKHAIAELDRAIAQDARPSEAARLEQLRDSLIDARDRLASEDLSESERQRIEAEFDHDWLLAQQRLDALRGRLSESGAGQPTDELIATRRILEEATLTALRKPLTDLIAQVQDGDAPALEQNDSLVDMAMELLTSYPDYEKLAERLGELDAGSGNQ